MTELHNWSRGSEQPGLGAEVGLPAGSYKIVADMPVALERRTGRTEPVTETRFGEQLGEHRRRTEIETTPAKSTWAAVALDDDNAFTTTAEGVYRLTYPHGGKGSVALTQEG